MHQAIISAEVAAASCSRLASGSHKRISPKHRSATSPSSLNSSCSRSILGLALLCGMTGLLWQWEEPQPKYLSYLRLVLAFGAAVFAFESYLDWRQLKVSSSSLAAQSGLRDYSKKIASPVSNCRQFRSHGHPRSSQRRMTRQSIRKPSHTTLTSGEDTGP